MINQEEFIKIKKFEDLNELRSEEFVYETKPETDISNFDKDYSE